MTVCIAATCNNGERIVTSTDGLVSMGDVTGEIIPGKMLWYGDWQFMYAGIPANFAMVREELEICGIDAPETLSRRRIQETVRRAYRKVCSRVASFDSLKPFDMTMEQFKNTGLASFGEAFHGDLLRQISHKASFIDDQILVTGWGKSPRSVMVYEVGPSGDQLHSTAGLAAIGSGSQMAQTMLLLLGQAKHRTLAETLFNVACAKFFSEKSAGLDVGQMTTMYVARKRNGAEDAPDKPCGEFVSFEDLDTLRDLWTTHLKPRIPDEAWGEITQIAARVNGGGISLRDMVEHINAMNRIRKKHPPASSGDSLRPPPTTTDQSFQPPSPESPGRSGEF